MSRRPGVSKKVALNVTNDLSSALGLAGISTQSASWYEASWFAAFKRRVNSAYVIFNDNDQPRNMKPWQGDSYSTDECITIMHNAAPEQRDRALTFLESHPDRTAYANMMRAFIATERDQKNPAFNNLLALYDSVSPYITEKRPKLISNITGSFDFDVNTIGDAALESIRAVLKVSAFCANDLRGNQYMTDARQVETLRSYVYAEGEVPKRLNSMLQHLVTTSPDLADRVIAVISNSAVKLRADEIVSVANSGMSTSLMDGLL